MRPMTGYKPCRQNAESETIIQNNILMDLSSKELLEKKKWARLLRSLRVGTHKFSLQDLNTCHAFRMVAHRLNKRDDELNHYDLQFNYETSVVTVTIKRRE